MLLKRGGGGGRVLLKRGGGGRVLRKTLYDASYSVVQGVGARRVGDVRRVGRCRGPTRRKIPISTVVVTGAKQSLSPAIQRQSFGGSLTTQ